ncbi:MAG: hypothetical protein E6Q90_11685 [Actinobacteria bacterium]|nr:MAG: hypothetical protein E6Q90_11685 [Actinomycetota bacterium]
MGPADLPARTRRKSRRPTLARIAAALLVFASLLAGSFTSATAAGAVGHVDAVDAVDAASSVHIVAAGDFGTTADAGSVLDRIADLAPDAAFAVGDLSYNNAPESDWCAFVTSRLGAGLPFELLSGNHESDGLNGSIGAFTSCLPNKLAGLVGSYGREYYVDLPAGKPVMRVINTSAGLHFPDGTWNYAKGDAHYNWAATAIDSARAAGISWVMVNNHYPCLGVAAYACVMPADFYGLLQDRRVDLVVDGHDHTYMRTHQLAGSNAACPRIPRVGFDADCVADSDNSYVAGRGTVFATVGTGGRALRQINLADPDLPNFAAWSGANVNPSYGVLDLVATERQLTANFEAAGAGSFADSFTITRPVRPSPSAASVFVPVAPTRVLDTRPAQGGTGSLAPAEQRVMSVAAATARGGGGPVVPQGALAVAVNLTVPNPPARGHLRVMPGDAASLTDASAVNFRAGESIANGQTARIAADRTLKLYNGAAAEVDAVVDVTGYFLPVSAATAPQLSGGLFTAVEPARVYDSAAASGLTPPGASTRVDLAAAVPPGATAAAYNLTVVGPAGAGHLRVHPAGSPLPATSTLNFAAWDRIANGGSVQVGADRRLEVYNASQVPVRFLVDVTGYYGSATGGVFHAIDPTRVLDTRSVSGGGGPLAAAAEATIPVGAAQSDPTAPAVPAGSVAAEFNATAVRAGGAGHLRMWPGGQPRPGTSMVNWPRPGYTRANAGTVGIGPGPNPTVDIYNGTGSALEVLIDVNGFYQPHSHGPQPAFSQ